MKLIVIVSRLLIVYGLFAWWWFTPMQEQVRPSEWTPQEKAMVIQRLKYHGLTGCSHDENGYYFIRDGKRCAL